MCDAASTVGCSRKRGCERGQDARDSGGAIDPDRVRARDARRPPAPRCRAKPVRRRRPRPCGRRQSRPAQTWRRPRGLAREAPSPFEAATGSASTTSLKCAARRCGASARTNSSNRAHNAAAAAGSGVAIVKRHGEPLVFDLETSASRDIMREPRAHAIQFGSAAGRVLGNPYFIARAANLRASTGDFESSTPCNTSPMAKAGHSAQLRNRAAADDGDGDVVAQVHDRFKRRNHALDRARHRGPADQLGNSAVVVETEQELGRGRPVPRASRPVGAAAA